MFGRFTAGAIETEYKTGHDPVTEADRAVDAVLRKELLREGEGWLSEESVDDFSRLGKSRVWVVDPLDGTREFVQGIPEFCVSIAMVENGKPVAGGICNPATNELIMGSRESGVTYNGQPAYPTDRSTLDGAVILASRSELKRGEWDAISKLDIDREAHRFGRLQTWPRCRWTRRYHFYPHSQKRVRGCRRRRSPRRSGRKIRQHARWSAAHL